MVQVLRRDQASFDDNLCDLRQQTAIEEEEQRPINPGGEQKMRRRVIVDDENSSLSNFIAC